MATDDDRTNLAQIYNAGDYSSEFEYDSENEKQRVRRSDLVKTQPKQRSKLPQKIEVTDEYNKDERIKDRFHILSLDAFDRHKKFINDYLLYYGGSMEQFKRDTSRDRTDHDVIREHHQFLWSDEDVQGDAWERNLAKKYYDKLFKEYCISDLTRYKENKVALRWRIEAEVFSGKGQFVCGEKKCQEKDDLRSWEVNFGYIEHGLKKNALVKIRLCPNCSYKLNYRHRKREIKAKKRKSNTEDKSSVNDETLSDDKTLIADKLSNHDVQSTDAKRRMTDTAHTSDSAASVLLKSEPVDPDKMTEPEQEVWAKPPPVTEDASREDEFEDYFTDLFL